jgi:hypothetical protein
MEKLIILSVVIANFYTFAHEGSSGGGPSLIKLGEYENFDDEKRGIDGGGISFFGKLKR